VQTEVDEVEVKIKDKLEKYLKEYRVNPSNRKLLQTTAVNVYIQWVPCSLGWGRGDVCVWGGGGQSARHYPTPRMLTGAPHATLP
jgi:hypothetical protein